MMHTGNIINIELTTAGSPVFGVKNNIDDRYYFPCFALSPIGASDGVFTNQSLHIGSNVLLLPHPENKAIFLVLGGFLSAEDYSTLRVHGIETALSAEKIIARTTAVERSYEATDVSSDHTEVHVHDAHIENSGSFLNLSTKNGLTLQGDEEATRIQFKDILRISRQNDASDKLVLGSLISDPTDGLPAMFGHISNALSSISTALRTISPDITEKISLGYSIVDIELKTREITEKLIKLSNHLSKHIHIPKNSGD